MSLPPQMPTYLRSITAKATGAVCQFVLLKRRLFVQVEEKVVCSGCTNSGGERLVPRSPSLLW